LVLLLLLQCRADGIVMMMVSPLPLLLLLSLQDVLVGAVKRGAWWSSCASQDNTSLQGLTSRDLHNVTSLDLGEVTEGRLALVVNVATF